MRKVYFEKVGSIGYQAYEYMDTSLIYMPPDDPRDKYYLFSPTEIRKIKHSLLCHFKKFEEFIKNNHEYRYYSIKFYSKEDEDFFLVLSANGIEL